MISPLSNQSHAVVHAASQSSPQFLVCSLRKMRGVRRALLRPLITSLGQIKHMLMFNKLRLLQLLSKDLWIWNLLVSNELQPTPKASLRYWEINPVTTLLLQLYQLLHLQACVIVHP